MLSSIYEFLGNWGYHHPIYPTEVHMPIGLVVGAVIFAMLIQPGFTISQDVSTTCSNLNCHGEIHLNRIW